MTFQSCIEQKGGHGGTSRDEEDHFCVNLVGDDLNLDIYIKTYLLRLTYDFDL